MANHLGGFTQIFPLPEEDPRQVIYNKLLQMEGDEPKKAKEQVISRRNTEKMSKLPIITKEAAEIKAESRKTAVSYTHLTLPTIYSV